VTNAESVVDDGRLDPTPAADPMRAGATDAPASDSAFIVDLPAFSGPLDLLLALIREEQVDIYDIPIARIAQQFVARIRTLGLNEAAEYLEMAARLLRIKAQMLLPRSDEEQWDDPRAELVRRLLEYQQMREVVDVLERRGEERRNQFARAYLPQSMAAAPPMAPLALSLPELLSAVDRVLRTVTQPRVHELVPRTLDVPAAIGIIRSVLALRARIMWTEIVERGAEPWQVLSTLLGLLELAKQGELRVLQPRPFSNVEITRDPDSDPDADSEAGSSGADSDSIPTSSDTTSEAA
jgi:segregation and condensation protein A